MKITHKTVKTGDFVKVSSSCGQTHIGKVIRVEKDIKNGIPGIDYVTPLDGKLWWCYIDQIQEIIK